jgi:hypothetical protein
MSIYTFSHVLVDIYHVYEDLYNVLSSLSMTCNTYIMYIENCTMYWNTVTVSMDNVIISWGIIYILEPVSVGGWTKIRLRRITRSSTCVCLRIRNYFVFLCATRDMRAARAPHSNFALGAVAAPCSIPVHQCALAIADPHSSNEYVCQFSDRSAHPSGRL